LWSGSARPAQLAGSRSPPLRARRALLQHFALESAEHPELLGYADRRRTSTRVALPCGVPLGWCVIAGSLAGTPCRNARRTRSAYQSKTTTSGCHRRSQSTRRRLRGFARIEAADLVGRQRDVLWPVAAGASRNDFHHSLASSSLHRVQAPHLGFEFLRALLDGGLFVGRLHGASRTDFLAT
jgi:hypothetical protein